MPPVFDLTINVLALLGIIVLAGLMGFSLRSRQLAKRDREIAALESEVAQVSAEILEVQKDYCRLQSTIKETPRPVISIKQVKESDVENKTPDSSSREKNRTA